MDAARWDRIQSLFHKVADLADPDRTRVLDKECEGDPELRNHVLRMLRADAENAGLLDAGLAELAGQVVSASPVAESRRIGPWELRHMLGEGGMGTVFYAVRPDLGTSAAVKVLRDSWLSPARRERFVREQHTLAHLDHPNIARLLDAGALEDGTPWFVMEYVEGLHLDEYCDQNSCDLDERLRLFRSVCEAVQFAHSRAVIHRDLKPSNVLVAAGGVVKLLDFGVARQLDEFGDGADRTRTGLRLLTPAFAAPEQLRGEPASAGADVYSLGVILFRLLTGRLPFDPLRENAWMDPSSVQRQAVRPSLVAGRVGERGAGAVSGISRAAWSDLDVICLKAMHNYARHRYVSAEALLRDIDRYLAGEPVEARPDSVAYRLGKFVRRHRVAVSVTAVAIVAAMVLIGVFTARLARERNAALAEAARTRRIQQFMRNLFEGGDPDAGPAHDVRVATLLQNGVIEARGLDRDPDIQSEIYENLGSIYRKLGDFPRAERLLTEAVEKRRAAAGANSVEVAEATGALALLRADQARLEEAEKLGREALELSRRALPAGHPQIAEATEVLGHIIGEKGDYARAIPLLEDAVKQRSSFQHSAGDRAGALFELSNAYFYAGRYKEADALNRQVLAIYRDIYGHRHPRVAEVLANLGAIQQDLGNYAESERFHREALGITQEFFGKDHYRTAAGLTLLARALIFQKRYDDAAPLLRSALEVQEQVFGPVHPRVASALNELGTVALQQGDPATAKSYYSRMLDIYRSVYPGGHYLLGTATSNLGSACLAAKEFAAAERFYREAVRIFTRTQSAEHVNTGIARVKLGRALLRQRRFADAATETEAGVGILRSQVNPSVSWLNAARTDLATIYKELGRKDKEEAVRLEMATTRN